MNYQLFGSKNSLDYDIVVFVSKIPNTIEDSHKLCKFYDIELSKIYTDKPINTNLCILENGIVSECFKGTIEELNNSLFYTYENHKQPFNKQILKTLERDIDAKLLRVCRSILSFLSRTELRSLVKPALRSDLYSKIPILKLIDFTKDYDFNKYESTSDIFKIISFQYGQLFSLIDGFESKSYTKDDIILNYPQLSNMINRKELNFNDKVYLNECRDRLLSIIDDRIKYMKKLVE